MTGPVPLPTKLCVIIAADADADRLLQRLVAMRLPATKIASTGGFLRKGNATIFSGVSDDRVEDVIALVREECRAREELMPVHTLPFAVDGGLAAEAVEVRVGGAIVFVLDVERFERA